jgi:PRC-barrel domain
LNQTADNAREVLMRASAFASIIVVGGCLAIPAAAPLAQDRTVERGNDIANYATWETVFAHRDLQAVLGAGVHSATGEDMGHIVQVLVDQAGLARAAVIDFGGFLGVGSRKVVVDWGALHFAPDDQAQQITVDLTRDQVKSAPEYRTGKPVVVLRAAMTPGPDM